MDAIHLGEVKYNCEYCGKMFPYRQSMVFHVESVHKGIRYNCEYCSNTYTQLVHLKTHMRGSHGVEYQNNTSSIPAPETEASVVGQETDNPISRKILPIYPQIVPK